MDLNGFIALKDRKYYTNLTSNPLSKLQKSIKNLILDWEKKGVFEADDAFEIVSSNLENTNIPRAYGLVKIHKKTLPVRIMVSAINSPTYCLDKSLTKFLSKHITRPISYVKKKHGT